MPENSPRPFSILDLPKVMPPPREEIRTGRRAPLLQLTTPSPSAVL